VGRLQYQDVAGNAERLLALTSLSEPEFGALVTPFETAFVEYMAEWTLEGKPRQNRRYVSYANSPLPTPEDRLLFILSYLKQNPTQEYHGVVFALPQNKVNQWVHTLFPVLQIAFRGLGDAPSRNHVALAERLGTALAALEPQPPEEASVSTDASPLFATTAPSAPSRAPRTRLNKASTIAARKSATR
jgi:hypothetical protein